MGQKGEGETRPTPGVQYERFFWLGVASLGAILLTLSYVDWLSYGWFVVSLPLR